VVYDHVHVPTGAPKDLIACRQFFLEPSHPKHRQYEALRAYFLDGRSSWDVAAAFGYSVGSFRVLCHHFRREMPADFFATPRHGAQTQPHKTAARDTIVALRKQNYSVYEISEVLQEQGTPLSPTGVREVLKAEGFAPLPRRLDEERPLRPRPFIEPVADVRTFSLTPREFTTRCGGLFLFLPDLVGCENSAHRVTRPRGSRT
jgi:transposase